MTSAQPGQEQRMDDLVERLRNDRVDQSHATGADPLCVEAADRLILYREALEEARIVLTARGYGAHTAVISQIDDALGLSRSGG